MADSSEFLARMNADTRYKAKARFVPRLWSLQRPPEILREAALPEDVPDEQFNTQRRDLQDGNTE